MYVKQYIYQVLLFLKLPFGPSVLRRFIVLSCNSFRQKACVEIDLVNCTDQNEQFILVLRKVVASTFYNNLPRPHLPFGAAAPADDENEEREEENSSNVPAGRAAAGGVGASTDEEEGAGDNAVLTVDLTDLPTIVVDSSSTHFDFLAE